MKTSMHKLVTLCIAAAICAFATSAAMATNLESYYFRYDFSDGSRQFIGSASQASDPVTEDAAAANFVAAYGQDGAATAVHVAKNAYGLNTIGGSSNAGKTVLAGGWTLAMSLRPGSANKGILFSLGRANETGCKVIFLASSSSPGKLYVGTARRKVKSGTYSDSNTRELAHEWELTTSADLTTGYHTIVASHVAGGTVTVYVDGELAGTVDTTLDCSAAACVFGNGIQFNQAHGTASFLNDVGYSQSPDNPDVAFQDVRFYNSAFTAEDAAAYAALYPATLPGFSNLGAYAYVQSYGVNAVDTGYKATKTTTFKVDYQATSTSQNQGRIFGVRGDFGAAHYVNGNGKFAFNIGSTQSGHWKSLDVGLDTDRHWFTLAPASEGFTGILYGEDRTTVVKELNDSTATATKIATLNVHLFADKESNSAMSGFGYVKIHSFMAETNSVPVAFFAPTMDANGAAGFTNVVAGTFHGECQTSPSTALTFTSGVGRAEDYRYRSGKFYSRIYASSADSGTGLVKFDGGEAAGTNAQFTARGRTAKIIAVPAEGYGFDRWEGDTWAIADGYSANDSTIEVKSDTAIKLTAAFNGKVATPALGEGVATMFSGSTTVALSCATAGTSIYYTLDGSTPTSSSTPYEGSFSFAPTNTTTMLKVVAVKDGWIDSDVFAVALFNLAVAPKSAYAQSEGENLFLHLDAIENAGAGTHADSPAAWTDLAGSHTVTESGSAGFRADAWTADGNSSFKGFSDAVKEALTAQTFTLEMVISHPSSQKSYEYWAYLGASAASRQLVVDLRKNDSSNKLVQGLQYRAGAWDDAAKVPVNSGMDWNKRQYIAVVCNGGDAATGYYDGANQFHSISGTTAPSTNQFTIGASFDGANTLYDGAEICAVRMTSRALTADELTRNFFVDSQRFGLENAPVGYCITNGNVKVRVSDGVEGFEFSTDGGTTWTTGEVWVDINTEVTLSARVAASTDLSVTFKNLPGGATVSGNNVTFTPTKPCAITVSAAQWSNNDNTGSFDSTDNWAGGAIPSTDNDFTVNISGDTVITVNETYSLGVMTVKGTGSVTFTGNGSISATMLNVDSGLTVDTCGKLTVPGFAGAGNVVLTPAFGEDLTILTASTLTGDLTIRADTNTAFNVAAATSVSNFYVYAATNAVVTMTVSGGSFSSTETVVQHGVLRPGSADAFNATPKVTVEDGGTLDVNGLALSRITTFSIAGAGAGDWPWALTSSVNVSSDNNTIDIVSLADDATIGGNVQICIGVRSGASFNPATKTLPLTLNGHTLTKTGTGTLWLRRLYSTNEGTIDVRAGTLKFSDWSNADAAYGESCVSNIALVVREGTTVENGMQYGKSLYALYFKTLDISGATMTSSYGAFGAWEALSGHGSIAKLAIPDGATATLDGNLTVSSAMTAAGALSLTRAAGVETNVTVAATGTLTATNAITVGAGVIFDIGANRPTGTFTVADGATLVLRKAAFDEDEIVVKVTSQPQNIVLYNIYGVEIQNPKISYDRDAGTVTVRAPAPRWTNTDGSGSLDNAANWAVVPGDGDDVIIELTGDVAITSSGEKTFGKMKFDGAYSVDFSGADTITLSSIELNDVTNLVTGGKLKFTAIAIPQTCTVTITGGEGLGDGGLTGKGTLEVDPGAGNTYTMTKSNTSFTGEAVIKSGTVKFGGIDSFGPVGRAAFIRVKNGAVLDENKILYYPNDGGEKLSKAILEEGAKLKSATGYTDIQYSVLTTIKLEGNAMIDTSSGNVTLSERWHDHAVALDLGTNTLTVTGKKTFGISHCTISGTGTIDIQDGSTVMSTHDFDGDSTTTCVNGTIRIREGASWKLAKYNNHVSKLSVKDLILDGSVTRDADTYTLTVTGSITGNGTTPMLTMGSGAVFKPSGTGYLTITQSLSGTLKLDVSGLDISGGSRIPLVKVPTALAATAEAAIDRSAVPTSWKLETKEDGGNVEYFLHRKAFTIFVR